MDMYQAHHTYMEDLQLGRLQWIQFVNYWLTDDAKTNDQSLQTITLEKLSEMKRYSHREREYSCKDDLRLSLSINGNCYQNGYRGKDINLSTKCVIDLEESTEPISRGDVKVTSAIFSDNPVASSGVKQDSTESIQSSLSFANSLSKIWENGSTNCSKHKSTSRVEKTSPHQESESLSASETKSESCCETKEEVAELDDMVRKGAISLAYFALDNSSRDQDGFSEAGETNEMGNTKKDTPQYSSESYESMVLKLKMKKAMRWKENSFKGEEVTRWKENSFEGEEGTRWKTLVEA